MSTLEEQWRALQEVSDKMTADIEQDKKEKGVHPVNSLAEIMFRAIRELSSAIDQSAAHNDDTVGKHLGVLGVAITLLQDAKVTGITDYH